MSTEAAASLFGDVDDGQDFFSSVAPDHAEAHAAAYQPEEAGEYILDPVEGSAGHDANHHVWQTDTHNYDPVTAQSEWPAYPEHSAVQSPSWYTPRPAPTATPSYQVAPQPSYDPYSPAYAPPSAPAQVARHVYPGADVAAAPPPVPYRSSSKNAYDPPIRSSPRYASRAASSSVSSDAYSSYFTPEVTRQPWHDSAVAATQQAGPPPPISPTVSTQYQPVLANMSHHVPTPRQMGSHIAANMNPSHSYSSISEPSTSDTYEPSSFHLAQAEYSSATYVNENLSLLENSLPHNNNLSPNNLSPVKQKPVSQLHPAEAFYQHDDITAEEQAFDYPDKAAGVSHGPPAASDGLPSASGQGTLREDNINDAFRTAIDGLPSESIPRKGVETDPDTDPNGTKVREQAFEGRRFTGSSLNSKQDPIFGISSEHTVSYMPHSYQLSAAPGANDIGTLQDEEIRNTHYSNDTAAPQYHNGDMHGYLPSHPSFHDPLSLPTDPYSPPSVATNLTPAPEKDCQAVTAPLHSQYAPSPSLLGSNDPLERTSTRAPVFSFGFGGKLVSCFHLSQATSGGFDIALSSQEAKTVRVRSVRDLLPASSIEPSTSLVATYPGPLFADPGTLSTGIMGSGTSSQVKTKKSLIIRYLQERAEQAEAAVGHFQDGSSERVRAESKVMLLRLLHVLVEHDGNIHASSAARDDVRRILTTSRSRYTGYNAVSDPTREQSIPVKAMTAANLVRIEELLLNGERQQAYRYALDEKLWSHAFVIAHGLDQETWSEAVATFIQAELSQRTTDSSPTDSFEPLKLAYRLFGGLGNSAVSRLVNPANEGVLDSAKHSAGRAITAQRLSLSNTHKASVDILSGWQRMAAVAFCNQVPGSSAALTALGDRLAQVQIVDAAHCCYLISPQTSFLGGAGSASVKVVLFGCQDPLALRGFEKDPDPLILSEIAEFALSLAPPLKSQETFGGLSHLQPYRLIRAYQIADMGDCVTAGKYCEAIESSLKLLSRPSTYHNHVFFDRLRDLSERLHGAPQLDKSKSWMSGKVAKPSLGSLGGWFEGRITDFIAGDVPNSAVEKSSKPTNYSGAFAGYSNISSADNSKCTSPSLSPRNLSAKDTIVQNEPSRGYSSSAAPFNRVSSAMGYISHRRRSSPVPRNASAGAVTTPYASFTQLDHHQSEFSATIQTADEPRSYSLANEANSNTWWGSTQDGSTVQTPTATNFFKVDSNISESAAGLTSFIESAPGMPSAAPAYNPNRSYSQATDDVDDDLGLGNSKPKAITRSEADRDKVTEAKSSTNGQRSPRADASSNEQRPVIKQASSSWLGWIWKRGEDQAPGPVRAKLGEENAFYYDKELKKWVNKKSGVDSAPVTPLPPPPPSRQATAPPDSAPAHNLSFGSTQKMPAPPIRPASVAGAPPQRRSQLGQGPGSSISLATPPSPGNTAGLPSRPRSSVTKRGVKSRYVDVLQQNSAQ